VAVWDGGRGRGLLVVMGIMVRLARDLLRARPGHYRS